jgi:hypothetical protein
MGDDKWDEGNGQMKIFLKISIAKIRIFMAGRRKKIDIWHIGLDGKEYMGAIGRRQQCLAGCFSSNPFLPLSFPSFCCSCCCPCGFGPDEEVGRKQGKKRRGKCK